MKKFEFVFNGYNATILMPDNFNGKWIWKTEFFYDFDKAEKELFDLGYARVYYQISNMYGSDRAVRLMHKFHLFIQREYGLTEKPILFGFSRGGLYAFNYTLFYPEYVSKIYLDAPVMNLKSWPPVEIKEYQEMLNEYSLNEDTLKFFSSNPIDNLNEVLDYGIPILLITGGIDSVVPLKDNGQKLIDYCNEHKINLEYYIKPNCEHHPHSLEDVSPIIKFCEK